MNAMTKKMLGGLGLIAMIAAAPACGETDSNSSTNAATNSEANNGGKGDTPDGSPEELCPQRLEDVTKTAKPRFLEDAVRWPCGDVEGVNTEGRDDRGQEYCEYFVVAQVPNADGTGFEEQPVVLGQGGQELAYPELNDDQAFFLEDEADSTVAKCVFTSWHSDINQNLPCAEAGTCPDIYGIPVEGDLFRMTGGINSNGAASDLVQKCAAIDTTPNYVQGNPDDPEDPLNSDFMRGCVMVGNYFGTHWRSSDPQICAAAMRLAECGCSVGGDTSIDLGFALVPPVADQIEQSGGITLRGFPLGGWAGASDLPPGCRYAEIGNEANDAPSQTIVECDLSGSDVQQNLGDPKEACRQKYGEDVVLYVPVPAPALTCDPGSSDNLYADTCGEQPWVITE